MKTINLAMINNVAVQVVDDLSEQLVPVKPVCEILGVAYPPQFTKLKEHPLFGSVITIIVTTGADGKQYEMVCLPLRYFPSWLFSIHPDKVKEEVREALIGYQVKCNDIIFAYFFGRADFARKKERAVARAKEIYDEKTELVRVAKSEQKLAEADYNKALSLTYEEYENDRRQLKIAGFE